MKYACNNFHFNILLQILPLYKMFLFVLFIYYFESTDTDQLHDHILSMGCSLGLREFTSICVYTRPRKQVWFDKILVGENCSVNVQVDGMLQLVCSYLKYITRPCVCECDGLRSEHLLCLFWQPVIWDAGHGAEVHISHVWVWRGCDDFSGLFPDWGAVQVLQFCMCSAPNCPNLQPPIHMQTCHCLAFLF